MKTILTTLNAKYIHTSLALRLLYVANKDRFDISFREYVAKEDIRKIAEDLLSADPDIIGIGIYIWNVRKSKDLISTLKALKPELIIIAGGPEVSYDPEYFLNSMLIDFVVSGEGEFVLGELLSALESNSPENKHIENKRNGDNHAIDIKSVSFRGKINKTIAKANLEKLTALPSPYMLEEDREDRKNRIVYFETSRGCPYRCGFCLSSLEKGVRYFPMRYITENLEYIINNDVRCIKFLDRTFNLNKDHTHAIFGFLIEKYRPGLSVQFEIYADLLDDDIIEYLNDKLPPHYFRFEIGIQSTYEPTNEAVGRRQDFELLAGKIRKIMDGGKIDLHLDLIAGLPYETYDRFRKSFNDVFSLNVKEVQLGFLKMLRGTSLRRDAKLYGYEYNESAPYEIIRHNDITSDEIRRIHAVEHALEKYRNSGKFARTMKALFDTRYKNRYFELFDEIGKYYDEQKLPAHGYHLEDIFLNLHNFLLSNGIDLFTQLRDDYYSCFKIRPHGFWENRIDKKLRKKLLRQIGLDKEFLKRSGLNSKIIEKQTAIDLLKENEYLLTIFCNDGSRENPLFVTYSGNIV
jgi:Fe-S oxidoreductase